jgi:hypothetical protein
MFRNRTFHVGACGLTLFLCAAAGHSEAKPSAKPSKEKRTCTAAFKSAQEREHAGKYREARELLMTCGMATCGGYMKKECAARRTRLEAAIPSIVPVITDDTRYDVQVRMDGELLTSHIDGRLLPVDPGKHEFTFSTERGVVATQRVTIVSGQHGRQISVALHASEQRVQKETTAMTATPTPPAKPLWHETSHEAPLPAVDSPESRTRRGPPALAFVAGGVGLAGVGAGLLLTIWARNDNSDLQASCAPNCRQSSVDHVRKLYFAADVSLGVGAVGLGLATYLFLKPRYTKENPPTRAAYTVDVQPTPSGAFATVSGAF